MLGVHFVYQYSQKRFQQKIEKIKADLQCLWEEIEKDGDGKHEDEEGVDGQLQDPVASRTQVQLIK